MRAVNSNYETIVDALLSARLSASVRVANKVCPGGTIVGSL